MGYEQMHNHVHVQYNTVILLTRFSGALREYTIFETSVRGSLQHNTPCFWLGVLYAANFL